MSGLEPHFDSIMVFPFARGAVPYKEFPLLESTSWDGSAAVRAMRRWASSDGSGNPDTMDWPKYRNGFTWYDAGNEEIFGSYKLPHHNIVDGGLVTDRQGLFAARQRLDQTDMPEGDHAGARSHLDRHYEDFGLEPPSTEATLKEIAMANPKTGRIATPGNDYNELYRMAQSHIAVALIEQRGSVTENADIAKLFSERTGLDATPDIYTFDMFPSTQALDSYGTRMSLPALQTYRQNAVDGVPFINSHRTGGGWLVRSKAELPLGYTFDASLFGNGIDESPMLLRENVPDPEKVDLIDQGARLHTWDYMRRGYFPNGRGEPGTDDIILGIESRSIRDVSIGFGHDYPNLLLYQCGLCGLQMGVRIDDDEGDDEVCAHAPMIQDRETGLVAFAWVYNSKMYERSSVWKGATPGAVVAQAKRVAPSLTGEELDLLEDLWHVSIRPKVFVSSGARTREVDMPEGLQDVVTDALEGHASVLPEVDVVADDSNTTRREPTDDEPDPQPPSTAGIIRTSISRLENLVEGIARSVTELVEVVKDQGDVQDELAHGVSELRCRVDGLDGGIDPSPLVASSDVGIGDLEARSDGDQPDDSELQDLLEDLIDQTVAARVRALGQGTFDASEYRKHLEGFTVDEIKAEFNTYAAVTKTKFKPGRPTAGAKPIREGHRPQQPRQDLYKV